jgi:HSP20 family molecular chaperone IbpA
MAKKIRPISKIVKIEAEIDKIFGEFFSPKKDLLGLEQSWIPCVDISEKEDEVIVKAELPGRRFVFLPSAVVPEKSKALLENGVLTILLKKFRKKKEKEVVVKVQKSGN